MRKIGSVQKIRLKALKEFINSGFASAPKYLVEEDEIVIGTLDYEEKVAYTICLYSDRVKYTEVSAFDTFVFAWTAFKKQIRERIKVEEGFAIDIREGYKIVKYPSELANKSPFA